MKKEFNKLFKEFLKIKNKGWIETKRKGTTGIGYTFEYLLDKEENTLPIPDFEKIEIKTHRYNSNYKIHLFNATPDGDYLFPIKRILQTLGYPDKNNRDLKVFNMSFSTNKVTKIGKSKKAKIFINDNEKKVELIAFDNNNHNLQICISWSYDYLKEKLLLKMKYLALISARSKYVNNTEYFKYETIKFYIIKSFDTFLELINKGIIEITFKIGTFKSGKRKGQIHDRGTDFSIETKYLKLLYEEFIF